MGGPQGARCARRYFGRSRRRSSSDAANGSSGPRTPAATPSIVAARGRGRLCVSPPSEWVESVSRTLFQPWTRMSGWWLAASASRRRPRLTKRHRRREVAELEVARDRVALARPRPSVASAAAISSSLSRAISSRHAHRLPRALRHRDAVRARPRRRGYRRHPRVRLPAAGARAAAGDARRDRPRASPPREIDRAVRELHRAGPGDLRARRAAARAPAARPDRHPGAVRGLRGLLRRRARGRRAPRLAARRCISLDPHTLGEMLGDVRTLAAGRPTPRTPASTSSQDAAAGSTACGSRCAARAPVRVAALEWLDPVFIAGHWTPQLIEYAGGVDVLGLAGEHSEQRTWEEVAAAQPEVVVVMPCGYDAERAAEEAYEYADELAALGAAPRRRRRRRRLLLPPRPAPGRRPRADGPHPAPRPRRPRRPARGASRSSSRRRGREPPAHGDRADHGDHGDRHAAPAARRRGSRRRARLLHRPARRSPPPMRPPMWPPIEMPGTGT